MRIFRYFDACGGIATLMGRKMRFASPLAFNDPFELTPRVEPPADELIEEKLNSDYWVNEFYERLGRNRGLTEDESRQEYFSNELPRRLAMTRSAKAEKAIQLKWELVGKFSEKFRLLCCSHNCDSILMWSHYADKHRGLVLEIETDELVHGMNLTPYTYDVRYRTSPPSVPALYRHMEEFEESFHRMFTTKALQWSYEEEVRIQFPVPDGLKNHEPCDQDFDPLSIKRVIVGCYNDPKAKTYEIINQLAQHPDYKHTVVQRAYLDAHDYKLRFVDRPILEHLDGA